VATKRPSLIIILIERNNARPVRVPGRVGLTRAAGVEAVAGACLATLIPESAALPDTVVHTGDGADDDGVVWQHLLKKRRAVPALRHYSISIQSYLFSLYYVWRKGFEYFLLPEMPHL
jgi:hypothetical protein